MNQNQNKNQHTHNKTPKLIPTRIYAGVSVMLMAMMAALSIYPFIVWDTPIPIVKWGYLFFSSLLVFFIVFSYQDDTKRKIAHQNELEPLKAENKKLKSTQAAHDNVLRKQTARYENEISKLESSNTQLSKEIRILKAEISRIKTYKDTLKKQYMCSSLEDTRHYASLAFEYENDMLKLFDPIMYVKNSKYAQAIDINANDLIETLTAPSDNSIFPNGNVNKTVNKINELQRKYTSGNNNGTAPVLTRERRTIEKIDKGDER